MKSLRYHIQTRWNIDEGKDADLISSPVPSDSESESQVEAEVEVNELHYADEEGDYNAINSHSTPSDDGHNYTSLECGDSVTEEVSNYEHFHEENFVGDCAGNDDRHVLNGDESDEDNSHEEYGLDVADSNEEDGADSNAEDGSDSNEEDEPHDGLYGDELDDGNVLGLFGEDETLNEKLLPGVETTKAEAVLMVITYAMRHCLSSIALIHLLQLINEILGIHVLVATKHLFQKIFHNRSVHLSFHFYCTICSSLVCTYYQHGAEAVPCPNCGTHCDVHNLTGDNFFITSAITPQLQSLFQRPDIVNNLDYRFSRRKFKETHLEDIYDGEIYKELSKEGQPLHCPDNFSYSFNSDGVPIFASAKYSMWPIFLMLNELPPKLRRENLILAGVWCGKGKPKMEVFLQKFAEEAQKIATDGVQWVRNGIVVKSKIFGVCCCVDAPARASMQNTVQFNGYSGCSLCYHPGKICNGVIKYPVDVVDYTDRTDDEMLLDMLQAVEERRSIRGVKGPTPLVTIPHFPIVWGFPPDFMHCCLLGVSRQLAELWLSSPAVKDFYIGNPVKLAILDSRLATIQPPNVITRSPRPITERKWVRSKTCQPQD